MCECSESRLPDPYSWRIMTISARQCGFESFAGDQLRLLDSETAPSAATVMQAVNNDLVDLARPVEGEQAKIDADDADHFGTACTEWIEILHRMATSQPGNFRDFRNHPIDETNLLTWPDNAEESWQRKLYDELTQDKAHESRHPTLLDGPDGDEPVAVSNTGIEFDQLRYQNWKTINRLLIQAQQLDKRVEVSTDAAIQDRKAFPGLKGSRTTNPTAGPRYLISKEQLQTYQHDIEIEKAKEMNEIDWRTQILRLRKPEDESHHL